MEKFKYLNKEYVKHIQKEIMIATLIFLFFGFLKLYLLLDIHTFGDSHSRWSKNILSEVEDKSINLKVHHLGPKLMNTLGAQRKKLLDISLYGVKENDIVVFSFGEIDVRVHLNYWSSVNGMSHEISRLTHSYFNAIEEITKDYKDKNLSIWIHGVVPPADNAYNPAFPFRGTLEQRVLYTLFMNYKLKILCDRFNYKFVDFYESYLTSQGSLNLDLSDGTVHIRNYSIDTRKVIAKYVHEHLLYILPKSVNKK